MKKHYFARLLSGPMLFGFSILLLPSHVFATFISKASIGTILWMAAWWILAPVDYAVTAFLPIALNAILGMAEMSDVIQNYASETILLLLGASILTVSWEETGLDKRIAAKSLSLIGGSVRHQICFWYILSAALSAVLPNAVVCATVTPIAVSMLRYVGEGDIPNSKKGSAILLTIAYAAGVGGLATPLGGAMNLVTVDYIQQVTGAEYLYTSWVMRFLPLTVFIAALNICFIVADIPKNEHFGQSRQYFRETFEKMDPMAPCERASLLLFVIATTMSFTRQLYQAALPGLKPAYVFIICAILSFFIPKEGGKPLMVWKDVQKKIIWDLIFVFAGGLAVGTLLEQSQAASYIGNYVASLRGANSPFMVFVILAFTLLLSDVTSNTATAAIAMPMVVSIMSGLGRNPIPYIYVASVGVNLSFMLPTSIRAIPVGYGLNPRYMFKKGVIFTAVLIILLSLICSLMLEFWPAFSTV